MEGQSLRLPVEMATNPEVRTEAVPQWRGSR